MFEISEEFTSDGRTVYGCTGRTWLNPGFPARMVKASGEIKYNYLDWKPPFKHVEARGRNTARRTAMRSEGLYDSR